MIVSTYITALLIRITQFNVTGSGNHLIPPHHVMDTVCSSKQVRESIFDSTLSYHYTFVFVYSRIASHFFKLNKTKFCHFKDSKQSLYLVVFIDFKNDINFHDSHTSYFANVVPRFNSCSRVRKSYHIILLIILKSVVIYPNIEKTLRIFTLLILMIWILFFSVVLNQIQSMVLNENY